MSLTMIWANVAEHLFRIAGENLDFPTTCQKVVAKSPSHLLAHIFKSGSYVCEGMNVVYIIKSHPLTLFKQLH